MQVLTPEMMKKCDQATIKAAYPEILLMESAALATAKMAEEIIEKEISFEYKSELKLSFLIGQGNNGGDGLAAARILKNWGYQPQIVLTCSPSELSGVNALNFKLAVLNKIEIYQFEQLKTKEFISLIKQSDLIVDALLGTGIKGQIRGSVKSIITLINQQLVKKPLTLAVDIPSGIIAANGNLAGDALKADYTVTMAAYKRGLLLYPGKDYAGKIKVVEIGIQSETIQENSDQLKVFNQQEAKKYLPVRKNNSHKGSFGKLALLAGSPGMTGAPILTAKAALKGGLGLVYLLTAAEIAEMTAAQLPELVSVALPSQAGLIKETAAAKILKFTEKVDLIAAGPGLGQDKGVKTLIENILKESSLDLILDADALNVISDLELLKNYKGKLTLTPHPGEMAALTGLSIKEINNNRIDIARKFAQKYQLNLVLKGAATITAAPDGRAYINLSGSNGLATAGSGDVLTGLIAALMAQELDNFRATALAVYIHGRAGEFAAQANSDYAMIASDIIANLKKVYQELQ